MKDMSKRLSTHRMLCSAHLNINCSCSLLTSVFLNQSLFFSRPNDTKNNVTIKLRQSLTSSTSSMVFIMSTSVSSGSPTINVAAGHNLLSCIIPKRALIDYWHLDLSLESLGKLAVLDRWIGYY